MCPCRFGQGGSVIGVYVYLAHVGHPSSGQKTCGLRDGRSKAPRLPAVRNSWRHVALNSQISFLKKMENWVTHHQGHARTQITTGRSRHEAK